jgi:CheY-like chemotaxis protein
MPTDILIIEDSPSQARQFSMMLERAGYTVAIAGTSLTGLEKARNLEPKLILLDLHLPIMDGFQVLNRLKRHQKTASIPVVMLTSEEHVQTVIQALEGGADSFLPKPDALHQLVTLVHEVLHPADEQDSKPLKVLVIDDDEHMRSLMNTMLTAEGYEVETAIDGHDALQRLEAIHPDLIFCDIAMPVLDGIAFSQQVKDQTSFADVPLILFSAYHSTPPADRAVYNAFLKKPFTTDTLTALIKQLTAQGEAEGTAPPAAETRE